MGRVFYPGETHRENEKCAHTDIEIYLYDRWVFKLANFPTRSKTAEDSTGLCFFVWQMQNIKKQNLLVLIYSFLFVRIISQVQDDDRFKHPFFLLHCFAWMFWGLLAVHEWLPCVGLDLSFQSCLRQLNISFTIFADMTSTASPASVLFHLFIVASLICHYHCCLQFRCAHREQPTSCLVTILKPKYWLGHPER